MAAHPDRGLKVGIYMQPDLYQSLQQRARAKKTSVSEICRNGALRELETDEAAADQNPNEPLTNCQRPEGER